MARSNDLENDSIRQLVCRIAFPSMLAQFVSVLYSIVDRIYIGNIPEVGDLALAGVGVCGPIVTMVGSVAFWIGVGGSPLMSIRMGEKNIEAARKILANCFLMLLVFSVVMMAVIMPLAEPMLRLFGASTATLPYAKEYFLVYMCGTVFALLTTGLNQFIIAQGYANTGMKAVIIGAVTNIILDPLFIFVFHMGVKGAAVATVISQMVSCFFVVRFLFGEYVPVRITFRGYSLSTAGHVLLLGFTPFLIIAIDNVMIIAMNAVLQHYGGPQQGDALITCATIVQSFMLVITMPLSGITGGTQTILGFNYGARRPDRVLKAQKYIVLLCVLFTTVMLVVAWTISPLFIRLFTQDKGLIQQTTWAIRVSTLAIIPLGIQYELVDGFTAIGKVQFSLPLSFWRKLVYFLAVFLIPVFFDVQYIFFAETLSDILGPAVTIVVYLLSIRKLMRKCASGEGIKPEKQSLPQ